VCGGGGFQAEREAPASRERRLPSLRRGFQAERREASPQREECVVLPGITAKKKGLATPGKST